MNAPTIPWNRCSRSAGEDYCIYLADAREREEAGCGDPIQGRALHSICRRERSRCPVSLLRTAFILLGTANLGGGESRRVFLPPFRHDVVVYASRKWSNAMMTNGGTGCLGERRRFRNGRGHGRTVRCRGCAAWPLSTSRRNACLARWRTASAEQGGDAVFLACDVAEEGAGAGFDRNDRGAFRDGLQADCQLRGNRTRWDASMTY